MVIMHRQSRNSLAVAVVSALLLALMGKDEFVRPVSAFIAPATTTSPRPPLHLMEGTATKKKKSSSKTSKKTSVAGGGMGFGKAPVGKITGFSGPVGLAIQAKADEIKKNPFGKPKPWLELGALLAREGEFAEARSVFVAGASCCPNDDQLIDAVSALCGQAANYAGGASLSVWGDTAKARLKNFQSSQQTRDQRELLLDGAPFPVDRLRIKQTFDAQDFDAWETPQGPAKDNRGFQPPVGEGVVHSSLKAVLPADECEWAIKETERFCSENGGFTSDRHIQAKTIDRPVKDVPKVLAWFNERLQTSLFPMLASCYPESIPDADDLRVHDAFVVKYEAAGQAELSLHQDESSFSFTIALNGGDSFEGGGTYFPRLRQVGSVEPFAETSLSAPQGGCVAFPGMLVHGGKRITSGVRYIIPLFLYMDVNKSRRKRGYVLQEMGIHPESDLGKPVCIA
jgi:hypothetical protein